MYTIFVLHPQYKICIAHCIASAIQNLYSARNTVIIGSKSEISITATSSLVLKLRLQRWTVKQQDDDLNLDSVLLHKTNGNLKFFFSQKIRQLADLKISNEMVFT